MMGIDTSVVSLVTTGLKSQTWVALCVALPSVGL